MDIEDILIDLRKKVSDKIDQIDKKKEKLKTNRLKKTDFEQIKSSSSPDQFMDLIHSKIRYLYDNEDDAYRLSILITTEIINYIENYYKKINPDSLKGVVYSIAKSKIDKVVDSQLKVYQNSRVYYSKMGDKLKKVQAIINNPNGLSDVSSITSLLKDINFQDLGLDKKSETQLCDICLKTVKTKIERKKKEQEQEEIDKKQALIGEQENQNKMSISDSKDVNQKDLFMSKLKNFDRLKNVFEKNEHLLPDELFEHDIDNLYDLSELSQLSTIKYPSFDENDYIEAILSILYINNTTDNDYIIQRLQNYFELFSRQYELYIKIKEIEEQKQLLWSSFRLTDEEGEELAKFDTVISEIIDNNYRLTEDIDYKLIELKEKMHDIKKSHITEDNINEDGKLPISSFIFFDYELDKFTGEKKAYVTTDLDPDSTRTLIDKSIMIAKLNSNGYDDFCDLLDDLLLYSKPRILLDNSFDRIDRIIRKIYYTKSSYESVKDTKENDSEMVRVKPTLSSYARFVDEKVVLTPGSFKFKQVKDLIESKYPIVEIDDSKPFDLYINYLDTFKRSAKENYAPSFSRQEDSKIRDVLKEDKSKFSDEDLKYLSEMIDFSMGTYSELEKMNSAFDFTIAKTMRSKTYR